MVELNVARRCHLLDAGHRLQGAKQHAAGHAIRQAGNIQAVVIAIDEVHVGETGRTEENGIPRRLACRGVRRRVVLAEIGLGFDDAAGENSAGVLRTSNFPSNARATRRGSRLKNSASAK